MSKKDDEQKYEQNEEVETNARNMIMSFALFVQTQHNKRTNNAPGAIVKLAREWATLFQLLQTNKEKQNCELEKRAGKFPASARVMEPTAN